MRLFILSLIAVLAMFQYDFWFGNNGYLDYQETSAEIERQKIENAKLSQRNQTIAAEIKDLKEGVEAIQERARLQYELVKPNETFYRIVKEKNLMTSFSRQIVAVVPAAGVGSRMQQDKPKQYLPINGKTILEHTVSILLEYAPISRIILAVAENDPYINQLAFIHHPKISLVCGGATRAESVLNGLKNIQQENTWALVHDAARPVWPMRI